MSNAGNAPQWLDLALKMVGLLLVLVGPFVAYTQLKLNQQVNRARLALDLNKLFADNLTERQFFYRLDYAAAPNAFRFDPKGFSHTDDERHLDSLLYKLSQIGYLLKHKTIAPDDVLWVASITRAVLENVEVHRYLEWLSRDVPGHRSFSDLVHLYKAVGRRGAQSPTSQILDAYRAAASANRAS